MCFVFLLQWLRDPSMSAMTHFSATSVVCVRRSLAVTVPCKSTSVPIQVKHSLTYCTPLDRENNSCCYGRVIARNHQHIDQWPDVVQNRCNSNLRKSNLFLRGLFKKRFLKFKRYFIMKT